MAMKSQMEAYIFLLDYINTFSYRKMEWYAGIASDPQRRLFSEHGVNKDGAWAFCECNNSDIARAVEADLLRLGCKGGTGGGDNTTKSCYVYLITRDTIE